MVAGKQQTQLGLYSRYLRRGSAAVQGRAYELGAETLPQFPAYEDNL